MKQKIWKISLETHDVDLKGTVEKKELRKVMMVIIGWSFQEGIYVGMGHDLILKEQVVIGWKEMALGLSVSSFTREERGGPCGGQLR